MELPDLGSGHARCMLLLHFAMARIVKSGKKGYDIR